MNPLNKRLYDGDSTAFVELYDLLGEQLFRYAYAQLNTNQDAADVVQEVFMRLVKSHRALARAENLKGYVFTVARNEIVRWLKNAGRRRVVTDRHAEDQAERNGNERVAFDRRLDGNEWVKHQLSRLDDVDREIVHLKVFSQLTFKEIAAVTEMKTANVSTRYRRALARLESRLTSEEATGSKPASEISTRQKQ